MPASFRQEERLIYIPPEGPQYLLHAMPWRAVLSEEGFGTPPIEYVTDRAPFQHGDVVRSFYLGPRAIQLIVLHNFCSRADYWQGREDFLRALRPRFYHTPPTPGKLLYYLSGRKKRQIDVFLESGPGFTPSEGGWREWTFIEAIRFVAHDPTWYDPAPRAQTLLYHEPALNLTFPIEFPIVFDETAGIETYVIYEGSWLDYPTIDVVGPVTGWSLTNLVTGYNLGLTQPVPDGTTVTITLHGIKTVVDNFGNNWAHFLTSDSDLSSFALIPDPGAPGGRNDMQLSGTGTNAQSRVIVKWYSRYFGI
jgi:hypothetical protein